MSNPSVDEIMETAARMMAPAITVGVTRDGDAFITVEDHGTDPGDRGEFVDFAFDGHDGAMAAYDEIRRRMEGRRRRESFRHQLEALKVSGRCDVRSYVYRPGSIAVPLSFVLSFGTAGDPTPVKVVVRVSVAADRAMNDPRSLDRLAAAVESFIREELP